MTRVLVLADDGNGPVAIGPVSKDESAEAIRDAAEERGWTLLGHARAMSSWSDLREGRNPQ
jgi:ribosomal protein S5